jgi:hypothetical protein
MNKKATLVAAAMLLAWGSAWPAIYVWNKTGSQSWATSTNWTPTRSAPVAGDTLRFDNGSLDTITDLPTQTVQRLEVSNSTTARLMTSGGSNTLTISGALQVDAGSSLDPSATNQANTVLITLASGASGIIDGSMLFQGANHKLNAVSAGAIHFRNGAVCTQDTMVGGNLFTAAGTANAVYFDSGSVFNFKCNQGANPFGLTQPSSKVVFSHGSLYRHLKNVLPSFSGRTYADFELNCPAANFSGTGGSACTFDTLRIVSGKLKLNLTRRINILGNLICGGGANDSLIFNPAGVCSLVLGGTVVQAVRGSSPLYLAGGENLFVNNASGILLQRPLTVNRTLYLVSGTVTTGNDTLSVASDSAVVRTSGQVIGNLNLHAATGNTSRIFTVGTTNGYSPAQVDFNTVGTAGMLNCRAVQEPHPGIPVSDSCLQRYWAFTNNGASFTNYAATFTYLAADFTGRFSEAGDEAAMLPVKYDGSWSFPAVGTRTPGGTGDGGSIQVAGLASFSDFTMVKNGPMAVSISNFSCGLAGNDVTLRWRTECESNSYLWIISRSDQADGQYKEIARLEASGNSSSTRDYTWTDAGVEQGRTNYYILTALDLSGGKTQYGPVMAGMKGTLSRDGLMLLPNSPNPFSNETVIGYQTSGAQRVSLKIYNISGQLVRTLLDGQQFPGLYHQNWDGRDIQGHSVPNGIYICRLNSGSKTYTRKMTLVR